MWNIQHYLYTLRTNLTRRQGSNFIPFSYRCQSNSTLDYQVDIKEEKDRNITVRHANPWKHLPEALQTEVVSLL